MSVNSSSSSNSSSLVAAIASCFEYRSISIMFVTFSGAYILLFLPLGVLVLYLGLRRWRDRRSASTAASHSDIFTYHMVTLEMIGVVGCGLYCCGFYFHAPLAMAIGVYLFSCNSNGQILFHTLTCGERHLAVLHPITYMRLRKRSGARIRNVSIGVVWLLVLVLFCLTAFLETLTIIVLFCLMVLSTVVISFFSVSVLHALIHPSPGDGVKDKAPVNQSKMRAFHTIMTIMGSLVFKSVGYVAVLAIYVSSAVSEHVRCSGVALGAWFSLPSSLVLPLLFLHRAGKLHCCKTNTGPGSE